MARNGYRGSKNTDFTVEVNNEHYCDEMIAAIESYGVELKVEVRESSRIFNFGKEEWAACEFVNDFNLNADI